MASTYTSLHVHLVWATRDRLPIITPEREGAIFACIQAECRKMGVIVIAIGGVEDHVHVLVRIPIPATVSRLVKQLKGLSSHLVNHGHDLPDVFRWQGGYGAFTVSRWDVHRIRQYVRRQKDHHRRGELSVSLESCSDR